MISDDLGDFKQRLPEVIIRHAEKNGFVLCDVGLQAMFDELGVEWSPEPLEET